MLNVLTHNTGLVGVDIGTRCVKVAQLARRPGGFTLEQFLVVDRNRVMLESTANGSSLALDDVADVLRACDRFRGRTSTAVVSMSACEVHSETLDSAAPPEGLHATASRLAERDTRLARPLQYDFWQTQSDSSKSDLHVLATSKQLTHDLAKQFRTAGWDCVALDGLPSALARAVSLSGDSNRAAAAIDWGWSKVTLCVVVRGEALFVRSFERGALAKERSEAEDAGHG